MSEPTAEEQAQMALKLADSVRELIRKEIALAFSDGNFMNAIRPQLRRELFAGAEWDYEFQRAIKGFLQTQMSKG